MPNSELIGLFAVLVGVSTVAGVEALLVFDWLFERIIGRSRGKISRRIIVPWTIIFLVGVGCALYAHFIEPFRFEVTHHTVRATGLPPGFRLRILHLTDLHLEGEGRACRWIAETVRKEKPGIIAMTGDYVNKPRAGGQALKKLLGQIDAPHVLAVTGNYHPTDPSEFRKDIATLYGAPLVIDVDGEEIAFVGCEITEPENFERAMANVGDVSYTVVLYHKPEMIELAAQHGADLYLCGHTHGGQIRLPFYGAVVTFSSLGKKYEAGRYQVGEMTAYVGRGIGNEGGRAPRLRFLCRPEIAVFDVVGTGP